MSDADHVAHERKLLVIERRNLAHLLAQAALHGGETEAPLAVMNNLHEVRARIHTLKTNLRVLGVTVEDARGEQPVAPMPTGSQSDPELLTLRQWAWRVAGIAALAALLAVGGAYLWYNVIAGKAGESKLSVRVADQDGKAIARAGIVLLYNGEIPIKQVTDSQGATYFIADSVIGEARVVVQAEGYQVYEETVDLARNRNLTVNMHSLNEDVRDVLVRVVTKQSLQPVNRANVVLIVGADTFSDVTDQNGLATFHVRFGSETLSADFSVAAEGNNVSNQSVSLRPDQLQEVRLDPLNNTANVAPVLTIERSRASASPGRGFNIPEAISGVTLFSRLAAQNEQESNDSDTTPQQLAESGASKPVDGKIDTPKDRDFYSLSLSAGRRYVVELFDVDANLALGSQQYSCGSEGYNTFSGLGLAVYDPGKNRVAVQCTANRGGDAFLGLSFDASVNGMYQIEIFPHSEAVTGSYRMRILPDGAGKGIEWNEVSFEPNNTASTAFPIKVGFENALTSAIDPHTSGMISQYADNDWYQFDAESGRTYVVELVNTEDVLSPGSSQYNCFGSYDTYSGLALAIYSPTVEVVAKSCQPNGAANSHNIVEFTAAVGGPHSILVFPHVDQAAGIYTLRVLPKHDEPGATRDGVTLEPNNRQPNAAELIVDGDLASALEPRTAGYATNQPDTDWYHFSVKAGITYLIELFELEDSLLTGSTRYNCYDQYDTFSGMSIGLFNAAGERVAAQCAANGEGTTHLVLEFPATVGGEYYIRALPHYEQASGAYHIRVRKK